MRRHYPLNSAGVEDAGQLPWSDGVPETDTQGSYPGQALFTDTEAEILALQDAAGLVRSGSDKTQIAQAVSRGLYLGGFNGSANALSAPLPNSVAIPALIQGMRFTGRTSVTNTGAMTVNLTGFGQSPGALPLLTRNGLALQAGDIPVSADFDFRYDGSAFRLIGMTPSDILALVSVITRVNLTNNLTVYIRTDGNDNNNGLTNTPGGAFATIQRAWDTIAKLYNFGGFAVTLQLGLPGTYAGCDFNNYGPQGNITLIGNDGAPGSYVITALPPGGQYRHISSSVQTVYVSGVTFAQGSSDPTFSIWAHPGGVIVLGNVTFSPTGNAPNSSLIVPDNGGTIYTSGTITINGNGSVRSIIYTPPGGNFGGIGSAVSSNWNVFNLTFASFLLQLGPSQATFAGITFNPGGVTGSKYFLGYGSFCNTNGAGVNYLPGSLAGNNNQGYYV